MRSRSLGLSPGPMWAGVAVDGMWSGLRRFEGTSTDFDALYAKHRAEYGKGRARGDNHGLRVCRRKPLYPACQDIAVPFAPCQSVEPRAQLVPSHPRLAS